MIDQMAPHGAPFVLCSSPIEDHASPSADRGLGSDATAVSGMRNALPGDQRRELRERARVEEAHLHVQRSTNGSEGSTAHADQVRERLRALLNQASAATVASGMMALESARMVATAREVVLAARKTLELATERHSALPRLKSA
jgi:hypothetical protein